MIQCKNCGYPVINGMHICPNCLSEMPEIEVEAVPQMEEETYEIDEIPVCTLKPLSLPGEIEMPEKVYDEDSDEVMLSRDNTVPHDKSIDDDMQACLFFSDGYWFIEDRSINNNTYVHAGAGIKLEPGDIIRMGDREFEFNIKKRKK